MLTAILDVANIILYQHQCAYIVEGLTEALEHCHVHSEHTRVFSLRVLVVTLHYQVPVTMTGNTLRITPVSL